VQGPLNTQLTGSVFLTSLPQAVSDNMMLAITTNIFIFGCSLAFLRNPYDCKSWLDEAMREQFSAEDNS